MKTDLHRLLLNDDKTFSSRTSGSGGLTSPILSTQQQFPPLTHQPNYSRRPPFNPTNPFDSSMAVTVLVLLAAFFFMAFFTIYARRVSDESAAEISHSRRHHQADGATRNASPSHGADPTAIPALPSFPYYRCAKRPLDCAVCLSEFEEGETVKIIPGCGHVYHPQCIDAWLQSRGSCPLCRSTRLFPAEEEVRLNLLEEMAERAAEEGRSREELAWREGEQLAALRRTRSWCWGAENRRDAPLLERRYSF